jgi:hypothetical protein
MDGEKIKTVGELKKALKSYTDDGLIFVENLKTYRETFRKIIFEFDSISPSFDQDTCKANAVLNIGVIFRNGYGIAEREGGEEMAQSNMDLRVSQKDKLFILHKIRVLNPGAKIVGLDNEIIQAEAVMEQEDVALVKEKISEFEK